MGKIVGENRDTVADVRLDIEEIARPAAPFPGVKRHHLHETSRSHRARRAGIEPGILGEDNAHQQRRLHVSAASLLHKGSSNSMNEGSIGIVPAEYASDVRFVTALREFVSAQATVGELRRRGPLAKNQIQYLRQARPFRFDHNRGNRDGIQGCGNESRALLRGA